VTQSRYAGGTSAPARSSLIDRSHGLSSSRDTSHYSPPVSARPQASASHEQHAPNAPAPQHVGYAPNTVRAPAANRVSPSPSNAPRYAPHAAAAPSAPQRVPRNAPSASHGYPQPPHVSRQAPQQGQRRG
jgi:hypothetical protein